MVIFWKVYESVDIDVEHNDYTYATNILSELSDIEFDDEDQAATWLNLQGLKGEFRIVKFYKV